MPRPLRHLASLALLAASALAQTSQQTSPKTSHTNARTPAVHGTTGALAPLVAAQQQALSTGDPGTIAGATRPLLAAALRQLATLEQRAGHSSEAAALRSRADTLADAPSTPLPAPSSADRPALQSVLASAFNDLGTAEAQQQEYAAALTDFLEAARWAPPSPALLRNTGIAAFRIQNYTEATRALHSFLASQPAGSPTDQPSALMLAMSEYSLGNFRDAASAFRSVSAALEQDPRATYAYAFSLARTGEQLQANTLALKLQNSHLPPENLSLVCHIFRDTESYEQMLSCYRQLAAEAPDLRLAHYQAGEALLRLDRPSEAVPELRAELAHLPAADPNRSDVQYSLAFALLQTSQKAEAQQLLTEVLESNPSNAEAQFQLGKLLLESNDLPAAIQHLEAAELNNPRADYIHYQLQLAYRKAGRLADAAREVTLYRDLKARSRTVPATTGAPPGK